MLNSGRDMHQHTGNKCPFLTFDGLFSFPGNAIQNLFDTGMIVGRMSLPRL